MEDIMITCDQCRQDFAHNANSFIEKEGDIETVGMTCPYCSARYVTYRTNGVIRNLQAKVRMETEKFRKKIVAGVAPNRAERKLRQAKRLLEKEFTAFNKIT